MSRKRKADDLQGNDSRSPAKHAEKKKKKKKKKKQKKRKNTMRDSLSPVSEPHTTARNSMCKIAPGDGGLHLVSFPQGPPTPEALSNNEKLATWNLYKESGYAASDARVIKGETDRLTWTSDGAGSESAAQYQYLVGVHDEKTGKLTLHRAGRMVRPLVQQLRDPLRAESTSKSSISSLSYREKRRELTVTFGSRRAQAGLRRIEANALADETIAGGQYVDRWVKSEVRKSKKNLDSASTASQGETALEAASRITREHILPSHDPEADAIEDVYRLDGIFSGPEHDALTSATRALDRSCTRSETHLDELREQRAHPRYILSSIAHALKVHSGSSAKRERRDKLAKILALSYMLKFNRAPRLLKSEEEATEFAADKQIPLPMMHRLLREFTAPETAISVDDRKGQNSIRGKHEGYRRTEALNKKLYVWMAAVSLTMEDYKMDISYLCDELRKAPREMVSFFRSTGATCTGKAVTKEQINAGATPGKVYTAKLRLPLQFPKLRNPSTRKKA